MKFILREKMFEEISDESIPQREEVTLAFWQANHIFEKTLEQRANAPLFSFYDGPPFATGLPHYGHLLAGTIKDVVPRYKTMKGFRVPRRFGWDCHGLPVEYEIEKAFDVSAGASIHQFGIARFNEECRKIVLRYTEEWKKTVNRMGRWVDFNNTYHTMNPTFMETVWWVFKQLYDKGLVYEGYKVMPFSAKLGTPLSNFEASDNYKDVDDPSLTVSFSLREDPSTSFLVWTTTPWTLVSNLALMVGEGITYVKVKEFSSEKKYIIAKERLAVYFKEESLYEVLETFSGKALVGLKYIPLFDYFADRQEKGAFRVIADDCVSIEEGTGIVHAAPAFGEVDFYACYREGIDLVCPVDNNGKFTEEVFEYNDLFVKDADKDIISRLKKMGHLFHQATIRHRYPFCWRSDTPLIYKAVNTWFVAVETIKDELLKANQQIHWMPNHVKEGRFGKWLEGARDWAISRNRYWGTPVPIWRAADGEVKVIGSIQELQELTGTAPKDLHRHHIDQLEFEFNGKKFTRIPEVFDCWFESGSMPYAQNHYPFENKEFVENSFPADFIAEGADQTRGWFYTLTILAVALFKKPAFKNVIVNGIILAEDGSKMSKRLKNYPEPEVVINKFGADAIRLYMLSSPAVKADDLRFAEKGVEITLRQVLIPLWNAYSFFITYARIYQWKPGKTENNSLPEAQIDRWMISQLNHLIHEVELGMDAYDLSSAVEPFVGFIDQLTNWYIRRSRTRFWSDQESQDRRQAFETLYRVLLELSKIAAPFVPFIADAIYRNLRTEEMPLSVHLCDYPAYQEDLRDLVLEKGMEKVQTVVSIGHALRKEHKIKVRQPLQTVYLCSSNTEALDFLKDQRHLIEEELNVKDVVLSEDEEQFVHLIAKPNFRVLGKKVGKQMKSAQLAIENIDKESLMRLQEGTPVQIILEDGPLIITSEDVQVEREVRKGVIAGHENQMTVVLDITMNEQLLIEGLARELKNKINTMRREADFAVTDRIKVTLDTNERVKEAFNEHRSYIMSEVLALEVFFMPCEGTVWDLNGEEVTIKIEKAF